MSIIMKAKFTRCGEPIPMRVGKRDYLFQENPHGDFVAIVESEEHSHYLEQTGNFEVYDAEAAKAAALERMKAEAKTGAKVEVKTEPKGTGGKK